MNNGIQVGLLSGLAALALLVGCGGGDDETTSLTKGQFVKQGNAICQKQEERRAVMINEAVESVGTDKEGFLPKEVRDQLVRDSLPFYEEMTQELAELGAPQGDEKQIEVMVREMEDVAAELREDPERALSGTPHMNQTNELARKYGLVECML